MSDGNKKPGVLAAILIAAVLSLIVNLVRLWGELEGWAPDVFSTAAGGGGSPLGISWLVLAFGFWFGRRLARAGSRPSSTAMGMLFPVIGFALFVGVAVLAMGVIWPEEGRTAEGWRLSGLVINIGAAVCGLATMLVWPRAWLALVLYGILARIPVVAIQYYSIVKGWDVHFAKGPPGMPEDMVLYGLTLAQAMFWPLGWTVLAGGLFAAIGASTVRGGGKKE